QVAQTVGDLKISFGVRSDLFTLINNSTVVGPRLSVSYSLDEVTKISTSVGRYYQSPSYIWLMTNPYNRSLNYLGMNQFILGMERYLFSDLKFNVEGYLKQYQQYPVSIARPYIVMVNSGADVTDLAEAYTAFGLDFLGSVGHGVSRGIDFFMEKKLSEIPLYGRISLSVSETKFTAFDGVSRPSNNDQHIVFNTAGGYIFNEWWEVTATFRYSSGRPYTPVGVGAKKFFERSSALYNTARTESNHNLDLRISRRWESESVQFVTYLDVQNVYNRKWRGVPFYSDVNKRIEIPISTGIVPSLGVTAEF
ncbi:MAG: TonB-dependent receptor, partial [Bacteroidota bacterium]